jgi:trimethylamine-N-oxide reductase (cytochrome c)
MAEQVFLNCTQGGPCKVHVKDGKIVKIRPIVFDENDGHSWTIKARGKEFSPPRKTTMAPWATAERQMVYTDERILYPLKRVDFDPNGERHPENRGKSGYERISWDEALDIVASEIKRVQSTYGKEAVMSVASSHHTWGNLYHGNTWNRFFNLLGFTEIIHNPDSWEGWYWGTMFSIGYYWRLGCPEFFDTLVDGFQNTDVIVNWSNDPETTTWCYKGQETSIWQLWTQELGIKQIFIDPFCNYTAVIRGDKWIAPRPGTDTALAEAIAYVWIEKGTYDKDYVAKRTYGFEEFKKHILGETDGIPKTPKWAAEISGVPERDIKALAKLWASKKTSLSGGRAGNGSACRQAYAHDWTRLMTLLLAMQGWGKPGINMWAPMIGGPVHPTFRVPAYVDRCTERFADKPSKNPVKQRIWRPLLPDAILNPPITWHGDGVVALCNNAEEQCEEYMYPEPGCSEGKLLYRHGGSFISTMVDTNKWIEMYQSPKLECVVNQDIYWNGEVKFADIILPACTNFERNDLSTWAEVGGRSLHAHTSGCNHQVVIHQVKCIEPLGESRSDYEIWTDLADRLGFKEDYTSGNTDADWCKVIFDHSSLPGYISWEDFKKKGYFVVPFPDEYKPTVAFRWFAEGRACDTPDDYNPKKNTDKAHELGTPSGKIEFVSQVLTKRFPDDDERPPMPRYKTSWEGHLSDQAKKYPLMMISPHTRFSHHTMYDLVPWIKEIPQHRLFKNGYYWHPTRINPVDAAARGIQNGDIVKTYNDRGAVLGIAVVTDRVREGVVHSYQAAKYDPLIPGKPYSVERGGCVNLLTPSRLQSKNAPGFAPNTCLVEISKWEE